MSTTLWRQRQLLELLLFKLEEQQLLLAAGRVRWLARAANEVDAVREELETAELARTIEVEAVAHVLGLGPDASLAEVVDVSPHPWNDIFADHREAFLTTTLAILSVTRSNRELLGRAAVDGVDRQLLGLAHDAALSATGRVLKPSLLEFLRDRPENAGTAAAATGWN